MKVKKKEHFSKTSLYFLGIIALTYLTLLLFKPRLFNLCLSFSAGLFIRLLPIFVLVFLLMTLANYFITKKFITRHFQSSGIKKWFFAIVGGILSTGPIYIWYPLLKELKEKGLGNGYLATFLYNRAIKVPLLPAAILYFGLKYMIVLIVLMIIVSVIQGILINRAVTLK